MTVERVTDYASRVLADNPGPMTLEGTNTWILRAPDAAQSVVVDPGPLLEDHLREVLDAAGDVTVVLLGGQRRRGEADQHAHRVAPSRSVASDPIRIPARPQA